jgi:hypothetical protein
MTYAAPTFKNFLIVCLTATILQRIYSAYLYYLSLYYVCNYSAYLYPYIFILSVSILSTSFLSIFILSIPWFCYVIFNSHMLNALRSNSEKDVSLKNFLL